MSENILLSIIVPVYNVELYLRRCLDSIVKQLCDEVEVIIVDDCSPDGSSKIYLEYEKKYFQVSSVRREKNGKISEARNTGIENAHGKFCWFIDSDDMIAPDAISIILDSIKNEKEVDTFFFSFSKIENNRKLVYSQKTVQYSSRQIKKWKDFQRNVVCCYYGYEIWNKIFSVDIIKNNKIAFPKGISYGEDIAFIILYLENAKNVFIQDYNIYFYLIRDDSMMGKARTISHLTDMYYNVKYINENIKDKRKMPFLFCKFMQEGMLQSWNIEMYENLKIISSEKFLEEMISICLTRPISILLYYRKMGIKMLIFCKIMQASMEETDRKFEKWKRIAHIR